MNDRFRMSQWLLISVALYIAAAIIDAYGGRQWSTIFWKVGHLTVAAHVGYWVDRAAFKFSRLDVDSSDLLELRRAIIISCAMLAMAMGM